MTLADIQAIADLTAKFLGLPNRPQAHIKATRRGRAHVYTNWFSIPTFALERGDNYIIYYTVHEVCHFFNGGIRHGELFKAVEDRALAHWGLYLKRKKVYQKEILTGPCEAEPFSLVQV